MAGKYSGSVTIKVDASEILELAGRLKTTPDKVRQAQVAAMNRALDQGFTLVTRDLRKRTGITQASIKGSKGLMKIGARKDRPSAAVIARSQWTPLSYFRPEQRKEGVRASPWRRRITFPRTFMATFRSGHTGVFRRVGVSGRDEETQTPPGRPARGQGRRQAAMQRKRDPTTGRFVKGPTSKPRGKLKELWGPSLAVEMMRGGLPQAFETKIRTVMPPRFNHELQRVLGQLKGPPRSRRVAKP